MKDFLVISILVLIISLALLYIIRKKKSGAKCIGCPYAQSCMNKNKCDS